MEGRGDPTVKFTRTRPISVRESAGWMEGGVDLLTILNCAAEHTHWGRTKLWSASSTSPCPFVN